MKVLLAVFVFVCLIFAAWSDMDLRRLAEQGDADAQVAFLEAVKTAQRDNQGAANNMQRGGILNRRNNQICASIPRLRAAGWIGTVQFVGASREGYGRLGISLGDGIVLATIQNRTSDRRHRTLIPPGSSLFSAASNLQRGDTVRFSGQFVQDPRQCIKEGSMTLEGNLRAPRFYMRFESISKL